MGIIEKQVAVTLATILVLGAVGVGYTLVEPYWRQVRAQQTLDVATHRGGETFVSAGCVQCHLENGYGTLQGGAGWPLNTTQNQRGSETERESRRQLLVRTIERGRGPVMAPYHRENGGSLHAEQINELVAYIQYGHWPTAPVDGEAAVLAQGGGTGGAAGAAGGSKGAQLFQAQGCAGCHQIKGQGGTVGPSLNTIGTVAATRKPGTEAAAYLRESITAPNAFVVQGFQQGVMPTLPLKPDEVDALVEYMLEQK